MYHEKKLIARKILLSSADPSASSLLILKVDPQLIATSCTRLLFLYRVTALNEFFFLSMRRESYATRKIITSRDHNKTNNKKPFPRACLLMPSHSVLRNRVLSRVVKFWRCHFCYASRRNLNLFFACYLFPVHSGSWLRDSRRPPLLRPLMIRDSQS